MSGLTRTKRIRSVSKTKKRWNDPGRARPDEPLADWCEARIEGVCTGRAEVRHHVIPRGPGSSDEAWNTKDICDACHRHIHAHGAWARTMGFLRRVDALLTKVFRPEFEDDDRCPGSLGPADYAGQVACMHCGHHVAVVANPDGGPGGCIEPHDRMIGGGHG